MAGTTGRDVMNAPVQQRVMAVTISHARTVSVTLTRRRKVMKRILISYLAVVTAILGLVCFLTAGESEGSTSQSTGYIKEDTRICAFRQITPENVETFEKYNRLIDRLEEVGAGNMTPLELLQGEFLTFQVGCGTVAMDYRVVISSVDGDYALFFFDLGYGFETIVHLMRLSDFHADELL